MKDQEPIRGVKIKTFNIIMIVVACILYGFLFYETVQVSRRYTDLSDATDEHIRCEEYANQVNEGSDILTNNVRLFVMTGDLSYAEAYFQEANVDQKRDKALMNLTKTHPDDKIHDYLQTALDYSNDLMKREIYAMRLVATAQAYDESELPQEIQDTVLRTDDAALTPEEQINRAEQLVFDAGYQDAKSLIQSNIRRCMDSVLEMTSSVHDTSSSDLKAAILHQRIFIALLFLLTVLIFCFIITLVIRPLQLYIQCISNNRKLDMVGCQEINYLAFTYNRIYDLNTANETMLRKQAEYDALTGIMNRGPFEKMRERLRNYPVPMAILIIDVDRFKRVNDSFGHDTGDRILKQVASLLVTCFRSSDFVARIGGDEFSVIMTEVTESMRPLIEDKVSYLNRILKAGTDDLPSVSLSVGAAFSPRGYNDELYNHADIALYHSKKNGRGCCSFYSMDMETLARGSAETSAESPAELPAESPAAASAETPAS